MSKHSPATPLPWSTLEDGRAHVRLVHVETTSDNAAGAGLPICSINRARIGDAKYLTHAALLKKYLEEAGPCDHSVGICICGFVADAEQNAELLRELGEV